MKKTTLLLLIFTVLTISKLNSQSIYSEVNFLKATNHLFSASFSIDGIIKAENQQQEMDQNLSYLKTNLAQSQKCYAALKAKYSTNKQLVQLKQWNDVLKKIVDGFTSDNWQTEPTWQLGYSLLKLDLLDMVNMKLK